MSLTFLRLAGVSGFLAVALGAFGAHGLKPHLSDYQLTIYEKAVQYQFIHTLALGLVALLLERKLNATQERRLRWAGWLFVAGIVAFSGSLYLLSCRDLVGFPVNWAGPVTPLGGLCFLAGWGLVGWSGK